MNTIKTTLITEALFSNDGTKRYLLRKEWDSSKPRIAVIMLAPSSSSGIELDTSTQLVLNNVNRLGFGSVDILNLSAVLNDFSLKYTETQDSENIKIILESAKTANIIVYAAGVGKIKNKMFQQLQNNILSQLSKFENKLNCLANPKGDSKFQHPLSQNVREWYLLPFKVSDVIAKTNAKESQQKKNETK